MHVPQIAVRPHGGNGGLSAQTVQQKTIKVRLSRTTRLGVGFGRPQDGNVRVSAVKSDSLGAQCGLKPGYYVTSVGDRHVGKGIQAEDLSQLLQAAAEAVDETVVVFSTRAP